MSSSSAAQSGQTRPRKRVLLAQLAKPLRAFMATEAGSAGLLLTVTVLALIWANSPLSESYESLWATDPDRRRWLAGARARTSQD